MLSVIEGFHCIDITGRELCFIYNYCNYFKTKANETDELTARLVIKEDEIDHMVSLVCNNYYCISFRHGII